MSVTDAVVNDSKEHPGTIEATGKHQDTVGPGRIQECGVEIREISSSLL